LATIAESPHGDIPGAMQRRGFAQRNRPGGDPAPDLIRGLSPPGSRVQPGTGHNKFDVGGLPGPPFFVSHGPPEASHMNFSNCFSAFFSLTDHRAL